MEKIRLGKTGMMVTRVGFGGIPIQRCTDDEAVAVIKRCLELGVNFIDTANAYTTSEARIGRAIAGRKRQDLIIATKTQLRERDKIEEHLELSLKRLGTDYIDLYQFHQVSDRQSMDKILDPNGPMVVLEKALKDGRIRHIGLTSHSMEFAKEAVKTGRFETVMFPFNFITVEAAEELIPLARAHDVGFIAMKPMGGGLLENAAVAFKYLLQFPDVVPIPGIEKPWEIEEIAGIIEGSWDMTEEEIREMQRLRDELGTRFCRRCNYCQPCTEGIPISTVMIMGSFAKRFPPEKFFTGDLAEVMDKATECSECGECEARCPYDLPIREMLSENVKWYQEEKRKYQAQID
jgi:predicted aldo/keto reductase-like oxidoreductase